MVTVILCVFLLSYVYGEGKVSDLTILAVRQINTNKTVTEQLLQRRHPRPSIPCHRRRLLPLRLLGPDVRQRHRPL